jgi:hypothetical protein
MGEVEKTQLTDEDLDNAVPLASTVIALVTIDMRPPMVVAAIAMALAFWTREAACGPEAAVTLFRTFYDRLPAAAEKIKGR